MTKRINDPNVVKARLKMLRKEKGLTQQELADAIHFSVSTIKQYENGYRIPDKTNLSVFANYFKVQEEYILGTSEHKTKMAARFASFSFSKEQISEVQEEMAVYDAIALIGKYFFNIDSEDTFELHAFETYIRLYPDFMDEYEQWDRKEGIYEKKHDPDG